MKTISKFRKSGLALALFFAAAISVLLNSCMPGSGAESGNDPNMPDAKPDPENIKRIGLFSASGDNLAGLGFTVDGYLTTILSGVSDWYLSPIGNIHGIGNVDYIPTTNWDTLIFPHTGLGFVGYSKSQGFTRFFVETLAYDYNHSVVGVGLQYIGGFNGYEEPLELKKYSYEFDHNGGLVQAQISGNKYATYQLFSRDTWLEVRRTSSTYDFINDCIDIKVAPNPTAEPREAEVIISTSLGKETRFVVAQSGNPDAGFDED